MVVSTRCTGEQTRAIPDRFHQRDTLDAIWTGVWLDRHTPYHGKRYSFGWSTIQPTPNLSATMPKRWAKKVSDIGMLTWPPLPSAANSFSASAASAALRVSAI